MLNNPSNPTGMIYSKEELEALSKTIGMSIRIQHEDIFNAMHSI